MKKIIITLSFLTLLFLLSCQKEINFLNGNSGGNGGGGSGTNGTMLVKIVSKTGSDSVVTIYTYNSNKQLINEKMTGFNQGIDAGNEYRYYRNASGIITHYVQINPNFVSVGIDSLTTLVHYNSSSLRYTSTVQQISISGFSVLDSMVFIYSTNGKIIRSDLYQSIPLAGNGYELTEKYIYTYTANGNIAQYDIYDASSGTDDLIATVKYIFDTKVNPLNLNSESFAIGHPDWISSNNAVQAQFIDITDPTNNLNIVFNYTYNSGNRPATAVITQNPGAIVSNYTFYYQ